MTIPPSFRGWWRCCQCNRENDTEFYGDVCPDCGDSRCDKCGSTPGEVWNGPATGSLSSLSPLEDRSSPSEDNGDVNESQKRVAEAEDGMPEFVSPLPGRSHTHVGDLQARLSRTSSVDSLATSLFSNLSGSSRSSIQGPEGAGERLAFILFNDPVLQSLLRLLREAERFALDRFERNLHRLLVIFSKDLYEEARSGKERLVARFVKYEARKSALLICIELDPEGERSGLGSRDQNDSESDFEDDEMGDLQYFESIILESSALEKLRANLRQFIGPTENTSTENIALTALDVFSLDNGLPIQSDGSGILKDLIRIKNKIWRFPPLAKGMKRVTWTCVSIFLFIPFRSSYSMLILSSPVAETCMTITKSSKRGQRRDSNEP